MHQKVSRIAALFFLTQIAACDCSGASGNTDTGSGDSDGKTIGNFGGTITAGEVEITVPPGALDHDVLFSIRLDSDLHITVTPQEHFHAPVVVVVSSSSLTKNSYFVIRREGSLLEKVADAMVGGGVVSYETDWTPNDDSLVADVDTTCAQDYDGPWPTGARYPTVSEWVSSGTRDPSYLAATDARSNDCLHDVRPAVRFGSPPDQAQGPRPADETYVMSQEAADALTRTEEAVHLSFGSDYHLWINAAFDSTQQHHSQQSYHYYGAAVDVVLCRAPCTAPLTPTERDALLPYLPKLMYASGFTWVQQEGNHVHGSVVSPDCGVVGAGRHVPPATCEVPINAHSCQTLSCQKGGSRTGQCINCGSREYCENTTAICHVCGCVAEYIGSFDGQSIAYGPCCQSDRIDTFCDFGSECWIGRCIPPLGDSCTSTTTNVWCVVNPASPQDYTLPASPCVKRAP